MKNLHRWFVYLTLVFLAFYLWRSGILHVPAVVSPSTLLLSLLPLTLGFLASAGLWHRYVNVSGHAVSYRDCVASMGLSVFGKYLPGKVWLLVGRAAYVAERYGLRLGGVSALSFGEQLLSLLGAFALGAIGLIWIGELRAYGVALMLASAAIALVLFTPPLHRMAARVLSSLFRRDIQLPLLSFTASVRVFPWAIAVWALWALGFHGLVRALAGPAVPLVSGLGFPLSASLGIIAILAPGGLGVREGALGVYLGLVGFAVSEAASISVASRLWFLLGELFFFVVGSVAALGDRHRHGGP